jgi:L-alanine-DL-glutamate epimerase-like enolase superfamily enzyme
VRICRVDVFSYTYAVRGGRFVMSGGREATHLDSTLVRVTTDDGGEGWGEVCPFSPGYIAASATTARAALALLAPAVVGLDPRQPEVVYARMDATLRGHGYAKSALDMACWDVAARAAGVPLAVLLGGVFQTEIPVYTGVSLDSPQRMRDAAAERLGEGYRRLQIKVGTSWREDLARVRACLQVLADADAVVVDANGAWPLHEAVQAAAALDDLPVYLEQPCADLDSCAVVRRSSRRPMVLDESLDGLEGLLRARLAGALDVARLKLARVGGISRVRLLRDLCASWGVAVTVEDAGGGEVVAAALLHLAASTPPAALFDTYLPTSLVSEPVAAIPQAAPQGVVRVPPGLGLGVAADVGRLGPAIFSADSP